MERSLTHPITDDEQQTIKAGSIDWNAVITSLQQTIEHDKVTRGYRDDRISELEDRVELLEKKLLEVGIKVDDDAHLVDDEEEEPFEMFDKFREEEEYKQSCLRAINRNISRNEIADIFQCLLPKDVAMYLSSYHRHPIDEFIGKDKLKEKESKLSIAIIRSHYHKRHNERDLPFDVYEWKRKDNVDEINYKLSNDCRLRLFYPFTHRTEGIYTKQEIKYIAERNSIKLSMNWKKDKMIEEFYKRS